MLTSYAHNITFLSLASYPAQHLNPYYQFLCFPIIKEASDKESQWPRSYFAEPGCEVQENIRLRKSSHISYKSHFPILFSGKSVCSLLLSVFQGNDQTSLDDVQQLNCFILHTFCFPAVISWVSLRKTFTELLYRDVSRNNVVSLPNPHLTPLLPMTGP